MLDVAPRSKLTSMHIARALRFAGYPLVFAVGEPLWTHPFSSDHHLVGSARFPVWAVTYMVFVVAFHLGASTPEGARFRRPSMPAPSSRPTPPARPTAPSTRRSERATG